ncbi:MAG TPA: FadD3 family acyl-CoA ligase [Acidimicrobiales bacterium]|nr:FadD3 family acyl-CoA ligase [Acidimicrobiales bacterium]
MTPVATVPEMVARAEARAADAPAVVSGDRTWTYAALGRRSRRFAAGLLARGIRPGDRVAVWAPNSPEWIISYVGLIQAGAVLVPVNTRWLGSEAAGILARSRAKALVTVTDFLGQDFLARLDGQDEPLPDLSVRIVIDGPVPAGATAWADVASGGTDPDLAEVDRRSAAVRAEDPCDILFTSGTTGVPKGVVMTHSRTLCVATDWVAMTGLGPGDRYLMVNPYFHMFGLKAGILASVAAGATMYPEPVFDVDRALARVEAAGVTVLPGPPTLYQSILDHPDRKRFDLSSLRVAVTGSADIPVELIRRIGEELPFSTIVSGYGLTEAGTASSTGPDDEFEAVATTVGRPRPGFEIRMVDGAGDDVAMGDTGEILLRGPSVMSHYLDDPAATAEALSAEGWLRTGDLGAWDDAGRLRIIGRVKDMYIVGGFNVYPAEVENALLGHPDVAQVAVIGVPDPRMGEVGKAFVVLRPGAAAGEAGTGILAWARDRMANYKVPRSIEVLDRLPLNAAGKVEKHTLGTPADPQ